MKKTAFLILLFSMTNTILVQETLAADDNDVKKYPYETVDNDPLNTRIYKLANGLTVYMSIYKDAPRIQTYIAVKAGSKNDPADATGLAHYLEHMLFKGTDVFGTVDYAKEKELIDQITSLYETYRATTDEKKRKSIYKQIDQLSGEASKYAIANEYDKMMAEIGAKETNAYTDVEQTVYMNDIPSNQLRNWLLVEAERFRNPVMRLFHTELEAVYEEKNISLDSDENKIWEAMMEGLWQKHQYGTQTTIGTVEHLKNPSLKKINEYYHTYYVPNNMALCLSGDFNPDEAIAMIDETFGKWKSGTVPEFKPAVEAEITKPIIKELKGPDAESLSIGFRLAGAGSKDVDLLMLVDKLLFNGTAGLIDLNLMQQQKVLDAYSYAMIMKDYSAHILSVDPKEGQTLEQAKNLVLEQLELLKQGKFDEWLMTAVINDLKLEQIKRFEKNRFRADAFVNAFVTDVKWTEYVNTIERLSKITKEDVIEFAKQHYKNNYVVVYKRTGADKSIKKVEKPAITPVSVNRDSESLFVTKIKKSPTIKIEPVFIDFEKDIQHYTTKTKMPVYYIENRENKTFELDYVLEMGTNHNKKISVAVEYLQYLGTNKYSPEQLKQEFYKLGCSYNLSCSSNQVRLKLTGLSDNFVPALLLFENLLNDAKPDGVILKKLVDNILKKRADDKLSKETILWEAMYNYGIFGPKSAYTNILSEQELKALKPEDLTGMIRRIGSFEHHIAYYGPLPSDKFLSAINEYHLTLSEVKRPSQETVFKELSNEKNIVYVVDYDMKQAEILMLSKGFDYYNPGFSSVNALFNEYFGGGMSSVMVQELRESKALAYSVFGSYRAPERKDKPYLTMAYIGTQADKLPEAMDGLFDLLDNVPESFPLYEASKNTVMQKISTERIRRMDMFNQYERAKKLGVNKDLRSDTYSRLPMVSMDEMKEFYKRNIKDHKYNILVLGNKKELDIKTLEKYGEVKYLTLQDIFGY